MLKNRYIEDDKLRHLYYREFKPYVNKIENLTEYYSERKFFKYLRLFKKRYEDYIIKKAKKLIEIKANGYALVKKELWNNFKKIYLNGIIATFDINIDRAFAQAQHDIEKRLKVAETNPGFFGLRALFSLKKMKLKEPGSIEGFTRFSRNQRITNIKLLTYVFLLISTGQANLQRRIEEIISFELSYDLVWIDQHPCWLGPAADEVCNRWRGKILSLHGLTSNFPKMEQATSEKPPLFHPNCTHSFHPLTDKEAKKAIQRNIFLYKDL